MGRLAETEGESKILQDLRQKLFIDPDEIEDPLYAESPLWLQELMNAWADGLNYYLATHVEVKPRGLHHFEPWMALSAATEGSIGGDIERESTCKKLEGFYGKGDHIGTAVDPADLSDDAKTRVAAGIFQDDPDREPTGSNGIAIAPSNTVNHHALLLINPHTSFFFRSELQMISNQGLDAYGAVTWGQFFVYQGFNDRAGWMHTSSGVDAVDEYLETVSQHDGKWFYKYGAVLPVLIHKQITVPYVTPSGMAQKTFTVYYTTHGPIIRAENGKWVAIKLLQKSIEALEQSYLRTKARNYKEYSKTMELQANSSNNTIFADADGDIAYWHGNYIPRRDPKFDFTKPVDGSKPETDWRGLLTLEETPHLLNPASGYLYNSNNWPWSGAGESSLKQKDYPAYVETGAESARGLHAIRLLNGKKDFTLDSLITAAYDSYLPWFDKPLPALLRAYDALPTDQPQKASLAEQIAILRKWDQRWAADSVATSLAVFWGEQVRTRYPRIRPDPAASCSRSTPEPRPRRPCYSTPSPPPPTNSPPTSEPGKPLGATSTASSASPAISSSRSTTQLPASPYPSPHRSGDLWPLSELEPGRAQRNATEPAATASSQSSNLATRSAPAQSPPEARAAIPTRPTSTTKPYVTPPEICAPCTSTWKT